MTYRGNFPSIAESRREYIRGSRGKIPEWPRKERRISRHNISEVKGWTRDAAVQTRPIQMVSNYFAICNDGADSYLKKKMVDSVFGGDIGMLRS